MVVVTEWAQPMLLIGGSRDGNDGVDGFSTGCFSEFGKSPFYFLN